MSLTEGQGLGWGVGNGGLGSGGLGCGVWERLRRRVGGQWTQKAPGSQRLALGVRYGERGTDSNHSQFA